MGTSTSRKTRTDASGAFFENLAQRGEEPLLRKVNGRMRFDIVDGAHTDSWLLVIDDGTLSVTRGQDAADCTVRGDRDVFDEVVAGRANAMAAVLRGALVCYGDIELLFAMQRIFPGPPRGWDPTAKTRSTP